MQIKAVTFDVGGTLIEPWPSVGDVYAGVAARHGLKTFSPEQLNARFKAAWKARQSFEYSRQDWAALVDEVFDIPRSSPPSVNFFPELYEQFAEPGAWRIFDDVRPALDGLRAQGVRLAMISNWDERLRGLLHKLELDSYFETFAISCEIGFAKPSPVIFRRAAAEMDLWPSAILHVGDNFEMDVEGAKAAGFHALQIRRSSEKGGGEIIHSLVELAPGMGKLSGS
jgi:putative hydrolase of the HAD superfamily